MGCASSTPMVQTAGSDMLKAATHVADDATKTAEDAVQGVKDSLGKTLDEAKDTVTTKVEEVKHDVEHTLKEKAGQLDEAKNSLMEKLHLGSQTATEAATTTVATAKENATKAKEEMNSTLTSVGENVKQNVETLQNHGVDALNEMESVLAQTDTETDSLKTSTPEPEIERAMANTKTHRGNGNSDDDGNDSPPTPIPTYSELENLSNELLNSQQSHKAVNDMTPSAPTSDQLMMVTTEAATVAVDNMTPTATTTTSSASTTSSSITSVTTTLETTKSSTMHITPIPIASATSIATAIASTTASAFRFGQDSNVPLASVEPGTTVDSEALAAAASKSKSHKRDEKLAAEKAHQRRLIQKLQDEKRPGTTEWEKYADTLAHFRKYNPQDGFRRGGTLTKFNGHHIGAVHMREKSLLGRTADDDSSDTTSNRGRTSPGLRSSARLGGRVQRSHNRPNSANQRSSVTATATRRNSGGRKFDFNPSRSRLNNGQPLNVSCGHNFSSNSAYRLSPSNGPLSQTHLHSHSHTPSPPHKHESVKSHPEMRTQHSHLGTNSKDFLQCEHLQHYAITTNSGDNTSRTPLPHVHTSPRAKGGSSMPPDAIMHNKNLPHHLPQLTRESSNTSLFSLHSHRGHIRSFRSTHDLTTSPHNLNPPVRNSSSFLSTPRTSAYSLTKSYTDLYFSSSGNKENNDTFQADLSSIAKQRQVHDKSPYKVRERCEVCSKKYAYIKT